LLKLIISKWLWFTHVNFAVPCKCIFIFNILKNEWLIYLVMVTRNVYSFLVIKGMRDTASSTRELTGKKSWLRIFNENVRWKKNTQTKKCYHSIATPQGASMISCTTRKKETHTKFSIIIYDRMKCVCVWVPTTIFKSDCGSCYHKWVSCWGILTTPTPPPSRR
jgi:hypothetical protein